MDARRLGALVRAVRIRKGLRQQDVADAAGVSRPLVSKLELGRVGEMHLGTVERIASVIGVWVELTGRWHGGDGDRLLSRRHSLLADDAMRFLQQKPGWTVESEVSFSIYGERGVIDQLAWHAASAHLLVVELKTEFVDVNEMLGTLDRKERLARAIAVGRGWRPEQVSVWLIVAESKTNRRHAAEHAALLENRFPLDGRSFASFLRRPAAATRGMAFWTYERPGVTSGGTHGLATRVRVRRPSKPAEGPVASPKGGRPGPKSRPGKRMRPAERRADRADPE
jgi:transcriptional regulator with XRE-family HTH domain